MDYETRFAGIRDDMRSIAEEIAADFDVKVEEYVGDELGYEFGVMAPVGEVLHVTFLLADGADARSPHGGNVILAVDIGEERVLTLAPHNYTEEAFAAWDDDEAWEGKIDSMRVAIDDIRYRLGQYVSAAAPTP
jgi:hypothetical protein